MPEPASEIGRISKVFWERLRGDVCGIFQRTNWVVWATCSHTFPSPSWQSPLSKHLNFIHLFTDNSHFCYSSSTIPATVSFLEARYHTQHVTWIQNILLHVTKYCGRLTKTLLSTWHCFLGLETHCTPPWGTGMQRAGPGSVSRTQLLLEPLQTLYQASWAQQLARWPELGSHLALMQPLPTPPRPPASGLPRPGFRRNAQQQKSCSPKSVCIRH